MAVFMQMATRHYAKIMLELAMPMTANVMRLFHHSHTQVGH
jgi:hypothetical protein